MTHRNLSLVSVVAMVALASCDRTDDLAKRIEALEQAKTESTQTVAALAARVGELETAKAQLEASLAALQLEHDELVASTAGVEDLLALVQVENGDVVIDGANLRIRSGAGHSWSGSPNGKGNLVIGYDERRGACVGGAYAGEPCIDDQWCTCSFENAAPKTGSHNLIIGGGHSYSGSGSILAGEFSSAGVSGGSVLGGKGNRADGLGSVVVGGERNATQPSAQGTVILGGYGNVAKDVNSTVLGGVDVATDGSLEIFPRYQAAP